MFQICRTCLQVLEDKSGTDTTSDTMPNLARHPSDVSTSSKCNYLSSCDGTKKAHHYKVFVHLIALKYCINFLSHFENTSGEHDPVKEIFVNLFR